VNKQGYISPFLPFVYYKKQEGRDYLAVQAFQIAFKIGSALKLLD